MKKSSRRKNILVTGSAGFIGSNLVIALIKLGHNVIGVDDFSTGSKTNVPSNAKFIEHSILEPLYLDERIDEIYNLACPASPRHYQKNPIRTIKTNTLGVMNILGLARKHGARILQASTSEIYGDPLIHPQTENYFGNVNTFGPRGCYDEGKRIAEALCYEYQNVHKLEVRVARIFNTYGPLMQKDDGRVVSNFIMAVLRDESLAINGDGQQTRSFCYISDMIDGLMELMESNVQNPINLGNPMEVSIGDLARKIIEMTGSKSKIVFRPHLQDDPHRRKPDIARAIKLLHWKPEIDLETGLSKTISYFKKL